MAKKIVRGITDVKTITNQDYDTNNVNDLLSDGQYNYIHRKKGENEEYHNLTDNIKTISSDNTELLSVTNNNKTTNTATLHPKHDAQKEQVLESTRDTITINHGSNGTAEKTTVDTNPKKVLEHSNLRGNTDYVKVEHNTGEETTLINSEKISEKFNTVDSALQSKQNTLSSSGSIGVLSNNTLRQLYSSKREYIVNNSLLKTHVKLVSLNTDKDVLEEEYSFILKINNGSQDATFTLTGHDKDKFNKIITAYGTGNAVTINGCLFTLSDHTLTVSTDANTGRDHVITFSDII